MELQKESPDQNSIRTYDEKSVTIGGTNYTQNLIVNHSTIISPWNILSIEELNENTLKEILNLKPKIILIGHNGARIMPPLKLLPVLANQGISLEIMSIGAVCRTFNILLSEQRQVAAGIIFQ